MPGLLLPDHDAKNSGCGFSHSRSADQMCCQQLIAQLSSDEQLTPEESLASYCGPVELYNIIRHRAIRNPPYLQRCLRYKIAAKQKKRIQITISLSASTSEELQEDNIFPLHVLFARPTSNVSVQGHSPIYRFSRACLLTSFNESGNDEHTKATFIIPDVKTLTTYQAYNLTVILLSGGGQNLGENNSSENHVECSSLQKLAGKCFWGKIPINLVGSYLENQTDLSLGHTVELACKISMSPGYLEPKFLEHDSCLSFCSCKVDAAGSYQLQVGISAKEAGAGEISESPYSCYSYNDVPPSSLPYIIKLRAGNVLINYKYCDNLQRSEVTEDFSCPICLVQCGSFKGLEYHLTSSHDLFHFEFWISKDYQAVNIRLKKAHVRRRELLDAEVDPLDRIFYYRSRTNKSRRTQTTEVGHVHPHITIAGSPEDTQAGSEVDYVQKENGLSVAHASVDPAQLLHANDHSPPTVLQFGKTRKLSANRADPRNRLLLQQRQFFHSHKAQPMTLEEVFSDHDSEDEVDDDIADLEDRRMLDDFVDVTKDEKRIMHMWNSFVRKQRILADGHIPWACKSFSQLHGQQLVQNSNLLWCWRIFLIKLWNHNLLDAGTMDTCNIILEGFKNESSGP